jgi:hypothetical protein
MKVLQSASKIVFVLMAVATCALTWFGKIEPKDFVALTMLAFQYYFLKGSSLPPSPTT